MSHYDRIDRALEREIEMVEQDFANGEISAMERNKQIRDLEREARAELRDIEQDRVGGGW